MKSKKRTSLLDKVNRAWETIPEEKRREFMEEKRRESMHKPEGSVVERSLEIITLITALAANYEHALRFGSKRPTPGRTTWYTFRSMTALSPRVRAYYRGALRFHLESAAPNANEGEEDQ